MKQKHLLIAILILATFLRFYNLMWGGGYFFHPDEGNMARSIGQMNIDDRLYPEFFAYGQLPLYGAYILAIVAQSIWTLFSEHSILQMPLFMQFSRPMVAPVSHASAVLWLRVIAATASVTTVWLVYKVTRNLLASTNTKPNGSYVVSKKTKVTYSVAGLVAGLLAAFTPGLIQSAHFGTTESLLSMFYLAIVAVSFTIARAQLAGDNRLVRYSTVFAGVLLGAALGSKITALSFAAAPFIALLFSAKVGKGPWRARIGSSFVAILYFLVFLTTAGLFFMISSPYHILAYDNFLSSSGYETSVATGEFVAFYTRQFIDTTPFLFPAKHIAPYVLGLPLFVLGLFGIVTGLLHLFGRKTPRLLRIYITVLLGSMSVFLVANSVLFIKWTRFLIPIIPVWPIMAGYFLYAIWKIFNRKFKSLHVLTTAILATLVILTLLPGLKFFTMYTRPDSREQASRWIYEYIPDGSYILSETGNVVDIPFPILKERRDSAKVNAARLTGDSDLEIHPTSPPSLQYNFV